MRARYRTGGANAANPSAAMSFPAVGRGRYRRSPSVGAGASARSIDPLRIALFLVVFLSIGRMHQHYAILALFRPALVLVGLATALALLQPKYLNQAPVLKTWPAKIVAAIGAMALASAPLGISLGASATFILSDFSKTLLLFFLLVAATRHARDLIAFSWAFALGCAFLVYLSLFFFQVSSFGGVGPARLWKMYMYDANDINSILVIGFGLVALLVQTCTGASRYAAIILMLGIGAATARSGSRGGFLGFVVVGAALLVTLNRVSLAKRVGFVGMIGLGLGLFAPSGYWDQMKTILTPKEDYNWSAEDGRRQIFNRGVGYMMEYPIGGLGIGNFPRAECTISSKAENHAINTGLTCTAPHNTYLQIGAELGIPGLILWLVMIFGGIVKLRTLAKRLPRNWESGDSEARFLFHAPRYLTVCLTGFAVTSFFVSHAYLDPVYLLMALMAGTYTAAAERIRRERPGTVQAQLTMRPATTPTCH